MDQVTPTPPFRSTVPLCHALSCASTTVRTLWTEPGKGRGMGSKDTEIIQFVVKEINLHIRKLFLKERR